METALRTFAGTMSQPLMPGDRGVAQTIRLMRDVIDDGVKDPAVNKLAIQILQQAGVTGFDREGKLRAIFEWMQRNILYVEDPVGPNGPKETIRPVRAILQLRAGDCDDFTVLIAALAGTIGYSTRAVTVSVDPSAPNEFSHVYPLAEVFPGTWVALDAARPGAAFGLEPARFFRKRVWSLTSADYEDLAGLSLGCNCGGGCKCRTGQRTSSRLNGYITMGDDQNAAAEDIGVIGQTVANVIAASKGSPYGAFQTPYSPVAPAAGYPAGYYGSTGLPAGYYGATATVGGPPTLVWGILLVVGLIAFGRK